MQISMLWSGTVPFKSFRLFFLLEINYYFFTMQSIDEKCLYKTIKHHKD